MLRSLVGSEMCIRDRVTPLMREGANDSGEDEREKEPDEEAFVNKHYFSAVSYTHLTLPTIYSV